MLTPGKDLLSRLARDMELAVQQRHLLALEQPSYETKPFVRLVSLLPGHFASSAKA